MDRTRLELSPGLWLDARRAVWLEEHRALLVADLHLGYAWAHREQGNLLPIRTGEDTIDRLTALAADYAPCELIVLGDVIHAAVEAEALTTEIRRLQMLGAGVTLRLIAGNHDAQLSSVLRRAGVNIEPVRTIAIGPHLLLHGDAGELTAEAQCLAAAERGGRVILGHEHPATTISDGVTTSARCQCFLVGEDVLVLPAFSPWSAGTNIRNGIFLSAYVRRARLQQAVAIVAGKLLPIPLRG